MIKVVIDLSKINKELIFIGKNGKKHLSLACFVSKYGGDGFVVQSLTDEQREAGVRSEILGHWKDYSESRSNVSIKQPDATTRGDSEDDIPF
jgi:hypothetical protein